MSEKIKFVFFGGEPLAVPILDSMYAAGITPDLVVANPDKPQGRNLVVTPPPTKIWAEKRGIPVLQPESLRGGSEVQKLAETKWDFFLVVSYGQIIPDKIIRLPRSGAINVHPSLLPKYRGPSPIVAAILNGDTETGVTLIELDKEMDHGPILAQEKVNLSGNEFAEDLERTLARLAGKMLISIIPKLVRDTVTASEQDHSRATFVNKISKENGEIKLDGNDLENWRKFRAYHGWPRTFFFRNGKRVIITDAALENGRFVIKRVIPEGKKEVAWTEFNRP